MIKCTECGSEMSSRKETRRGYSGLEDVVVEDVEVRNCEACGETQVSYPRVLQLHFTIARELAEKPGQLAPAEVRFLRTYLGLSTDDLATRMGVSRDSVTRWERTVGKPTPMGPISERLLRLMAMRDRPVSEYPNETLDRVASHSSKRAAFRVEPFNDGWKIVRAEATEASPPPAALRRRVSPSKLTARASSTLKS